MTDYAQAGKPTAIGRTVVRENGVSGHHGDLIDGPLEPPAMSQHYGIDRPLNLILIMPRDASLSDIRRHFFSLGLCRRKA